jgi:hypothetical protein
MAVEAGAASIDPQARVEHQLCVPAVELNGESYRLKHSKSRRRTRSAPAQELLVDPDTGEISSS